MIQAVRCLLALLLFAIAAPVAAQPPTPSDVLQQRADEIVRIIRGEGDYAATFAPGFIAQVPAEQIRAISGQLIAANGALQRVEGIDRDNERAGTVRFGFERSIVRMRLVVDEAAPHLVTQLLVTGSEPRGGDSAATIIGELRQLPGQTTFAVARLGTGAPTMVAALEPDRALAIGSTFKLLILAELGRQVQAGERRWDQVVTIDRHSLPSGLLQDWPLGSPVTVHTLASLMISRSDNTATDILLNLAGRENVERMMTRIGMSQATRNRPMLSTMELFRLKAATPEARAAWVAADEASRRRLLRQTYGDSAPALDVQRMFSAGPTAIDTIEWFASSSDLVKVMDWIRRNGDDTARSVMAINSGLGADGARRFGYVGFKGGWEPGVINLTYLVRDNAGVWHVVTGGWNNPAAPVDEARFHGLMVRAVNLVR